MQQNLLPNVANVWNDYCVLQEGRGRWHLEQELVSEWVFLIASMILCIQIYTMDS